MAPCSFRIDKESLQYCSTVVVETTLQDGGLMIKAVGKAISCSRSLSSWQDGNPQPGTGSAPGWRQLFMLAALTPFLIDLCSEWSVNTAEQTYNGTINHRLECRTTLYQGRGFAEPWRQLERMIARCFVSQLSRTWAHTHLRNSD